MFRQSVYSTFLYILLYSFLQTSSRHKSVHESQNVNWFYLLVFVEHKVYDSSTQPSREIFDKFHIDIQNRFRVDVHNFLDGFLYIPI